MRRRPLTPGIDLAANTRYWIEVEKSFNALTEWAWTYDTSGVGVAGEYFADPTPPYPNTSFAAYRMEVSGATASPAPEASTWAIWASASRR